MKTSPLLILILCISQAMAQNYKAITGATIIRTDKPDIILNATILINNNQIEKIGAKIKLPPNTQIIDATGKYIIPGLVDGHIHFFQSGGLYTRPDGIDLRKRVPYLEEQAWIRANIDDVFKRYISCGITSVVDMGGPQWNFDVRAYSKKAAIAPRVCLSGPLIASYQPEALTTADPPIIKVTTVEEALKLVRQQIDSNTDFIKVWYVVTAGQTGEEFEPIFKAIVEESHKNGKRVFVHALELDASAKRALKLGADVLVHNVRDKPVDEEFILLMKKNNAILIPTMWVMDSYAAVYTKQLDLLPVEHLKGNPKVIGSLYDMWELNEDELSVRIKALQKDHKPITSTEVLLSNLNILQSKGITLAAGTDAGNIGVIHGPSLFHEFQLMSQAGLTNWEILADATLNGAKLTGNEKTLGSIETGKLADLVILNSNPLENIQNTSDIHLVMKDGNIFYPEKVIIPTAEDLVQIQLNAYNEKDLEAFLSVYAEDVEVYTFPNELQYKGKEKMRELYKSFFERAGDLHCQLVNRITYGNYVLDREHVTTTIPGRESFEGQAIYEITDGKIGKIWFIK